LFVIATAYGSSYLTSFLNRFRSRSGRFFLFVTGGACDGKRSQRQSSRIRKGPKRVNIHSFINL
jgi:hypothetical protein